MKTKTKKTKCTHNKRQILNGVIFCRNKECNWIKKITIEITCK